MRRFKKAVKISILSAGLLGVVILLFGVIGMPSRFSAWITCADHVLNEPPSTIIVLGGGGIPSESGLMRTYYGAEAALANPSATVILSLPTEKDPLESSVGRMRDELVMRGVPAESIRLEYRALNTHQQAEAIRDMLGNEGILEPVLLVTSPSHQRRAYLCFERVGFRYVGSLSAAGVSHEADPGPNAQWRYGFWNNMEWQLRCLRECVAIAYYRLRGWA